jgi:hypothetical protein
MDVVTLFPSIRFETERHYPKSGNKDPSLVDNIVYNKSVAISSKILEGEKKYFSKIILDEIERIRQQIIDSSGDVITDFIVIIDKNRKDELFKVDNSDLLQIINYYAYVNNLDHDNPLDFITIKFFQSGLIFSSLNNERGGWVDKYLYLLNQPQTHFSPLLFYKASDSVVLQTLEYLIKKDPPLYDKLINSITLFNQSCRISKFSQSSAIVLLTSAFESLLQIPRNSKKDNFAFAFKLFWGFDQRIEEWAAQLYDLRNHIVHGSVINEKKLYASDYEHYQNFKIGREVFHSALVMLLNIRGVIIIEEEFRFNETRDLRNKIIPNKEKADIILKSKKKYTYRSFKKNPKLYEEFIRRIEEFTSLDYSAKQNILPIVRIIFDILFNWSDELINESRSSLDKNKFLIHPFEQWEKIKILVKELDKITWSDEGKFKLTDLLKDVETPLRELFPDIHKKDEFKFDIGEFGGRCLKALWATY